MPETVRFETSDEKEINEIQFKRVIKGIPSLVTTFFLKNQSDSLSFKGKLVVVPAYGRSFSEDAAISENGQVWVRSIPFDIAPLQRKELKGRIVSLDTPAGVAGKASVVILNGEWY
jgi:hypothetical protein